MIPNLFIIGAPKCGTSSLFNWLAQHPEIVGSTVKEPFYLIDRGHPFTRRPNVHDDGLNAYSKYFPGDARSARFRMEATTHYLFQTTALTTIASQPDTRVIAVLREPASRVYSSYSYTANNLARLDPRLTFERYLDLVTNEQPLYPHWCRHKGSAYVLSRDLFYSRYALHLTPWLEAMGIARVRVVFLEEMRQDPMAEVASVFNWLGLDLDVNAIRTESSYNRTVNVRAPRIQAAIRGLNAFIRPPATIRNVLKKLYASAQFCVENQNSLSDRNAIDALRQRYADDNLSLARLIDRRTPPWSERVSLNDH